MAAASRGRRTGINFADTFGQRRPEAVYVLRRNNVKLHMARIFKKQPITSRIDAGSPSCVHSPVRCKYVRMLHDTMSHQLSPSTSHCIATCIIVDSSVNCDTTPQVGYNNIDDNVAAKGAATQLNKKNEQLSHSVHQMSESTMRQYISTNNVMLFQGLTTAGNQTDQLKQIFQLELCSYPPAIFEVIVL